MAVDAMETTTTREGPPAAKRARKAGNSFPWVEKYRPEVLSDVVGNVETISRLAAIAKTGNLPNVILSGPPGTGKTTSMLCLARQMLGSSATEAVLELNASDDRGIEVVRERIKMFAKKRVAHLPPGMHKLVILDEADAMTTAAQQAMRRTMEIYSPTTRFALACNNSSKIAEPIQSRCAILRFSRLTDAQVLKHLKKVCAAEGVEATDTGLEALVFTAEGDMRNALNNLQSTHSGFGVVTHDTVFKVCDQPHPQTAKEILLAVLGASSATSANKLTAAAAQAAGIKNTPDLDLALAKLRGLYDKGYAPVDLCSTLFKVAKGLDIDEARKLDAIKQIGLVHMRISDGTATLLQLSALLARLYAASSK